MFGTEGAKVARNLLGNLICQALSLTDLQTQNGTWFIFQDLAVRTEGGYSLRFSLVDLDSRTHEAILHPPILAECFSSPFTVYSAREHPGLPMNTQLEKHFITQGHRIKIRAAPGGSKPSSSVPAPKSSSSSSTRSRSSSGKASTIAREEDGNATEILEGDGDETEVPKGEDGDDVNSISQFRMDEL